VDAETYLRRLVAERIRGLSPDRGDQHEGWEILREISIAAIALVSVGAMERRVAEELVQGTRSALVERGAVTPDMIAPEPFGDAAPVGPASWGAEAAPVTRLIRVIPILGELGDIDGAAQVTLISADVWTNHLVIRYAMAAPRDRRRRPRWMCTIDDDVGTVYMEAGGSGGGGDGWWQEERRFEPAPPPKARQLSFVVRRIGEPRDEPRSDLPWTGSGPLGEEILRFEIRLD
jgi:hypothetical protein